MSEPEKLPVQAARAGQAAAWDALFRRYQLPLYVYVFELVRHEQTSLDLVQETFINAARHLDSLRQDAKFGSWLFGIAHQKCLQHWRKRTLEQLPLAAEDEEQPAPEADPQEWLISQEQEREFMKLLGQLPPPQRAALLLHFVEEFSLEEIAQITGSRLGTVKSRIYYAKKNLKKLLEENKP